MRREFKHWSLSLIGLGVGVGVGWVLGRAAVVVAAGVLMAGLVFAIVGTWPVGTSSPESAARQARREARWLEQASRPTLVGLGTRVEQILRLAEEQANNHRESAAREADQILAAARREAEAIIGGAHAQADDADVRSIAPPKWTVDGQTLTMAIGPSLSPLQADTYPGCRAACAITRWRWCSTP